MQHGAVFAMNPASFGRRISPRDRPGARRLAVAGPEPPSTMRVRNFATPPGRREMSESSRVAAEPTSPSRRSPFAGRMARRILAPLERIRRGLLTIVMPDGEARTFGAAHDALRAKVTVLDPKMLWRVVRDGEIGFGEAYVDGEWECDDLVALLRIFHENAEMIDSSASRGGFVGMIANTIRHRLRRNSSSGSRENVRDHYDLGDDLYEKLLDPTMSYSCGIYGSRHDDLETAQHNKIDAILDLARLDESSSLLEIGCGWGSVSVEAAKRHGLGTEATSLVCRAT